ncbi:UDP-4-amino-4,6-dideoxy-N-acetyl-beta-L-altrosamine transaminase [Pseudoalteromonas luteoviolacea]|uniref:UDP-4-amino-4, 6-dideoxy-N-acetyl-beta-L-altrosamine transaminase n=1 Tax=Pseudoalteromonas luteoviolacea TaxID=43657 RepID=UPI001B371A82|nr:UDP-4-amino-4,6-dideoxy-N-acetyl-beta-L-altrosamine transaminase [Pseudoalteromonas luteoviolacea]MBQ4810447.1 UDP-4-amino-4,6-dideoxy-N-acetyl-beta-L-altrosamine transaminase [Pseudoalteromonas luteoviolacea]
MIPYGKQVISQSDIDAVIEVLNSPWLTQGPKIPEFESSVRQYCHANHATAVNSATSALHIACLALDVGHNDIVWTSPNSFVASANCALYCGAKVDFVDIDSNTGNMCVNNLESKLISARENNALPKVVIPVHFAGQSCDMETLHNLSVEYNFRIIEDASHAIGGQYKNHPVGNCQYSDICIFSFHPVKIVTSAEGGMALTNSKELDARLKLYRSHGITADPHLLEKDSDGPWYYEQQALGFNYRMTDLHAALGISQLNQLNQFVSKRNELAAYYDALFIKHDEIRPLTQSDDVYNAYHLYVVRIANATPLLHKQIVTELRAKNIFCHVHYIPIYLQPYYRQQGFQQGYCPNAEAYYHSAVTLPLFPELTQQEQDYIVATFVETLTELSNAEK